tara:strand:+ start:5901 stop:6239 length:339 start_codon:yes stop_codon:yes gene_type:complete
MAREIKIQKKVYSQEKFKKVIDTSFKTFTQPESIDENDTIEELFRLYELLYSSIPASGDTGSHEFLIKESSKIFNGESNLNNIQPLLDEIAELRFQLLSANKTIVDLQTKDE